MRVFPDSLLLSLIKIKHAQQSQAVFEHLQPEYFEAFGAYMGTKRAHYVKFCEHLTEEDLMPLLPLLHLFLDLARIIHVVFR